MKIIHIVDGIDISYNNGEINKETVFAFDENNNYIQGFTYNVKDVYSPEITSLIINKEKIKVDEKCFLYYAFHYQISFAHYLFQCLPKLGEYLLNYKDCKLVVPRSTFNKLAIDIFKICNIDNKNILILENNVVYEFSEIYNHKTNQDMIMNDNMLYIFNYIRQKIDVKPNDKPIRKIYLKRDGLPNVKYGNNETGIKRQIPNEQELINYLISLNFEIITLGDKSIIEKKSLLENAKIIITQNGANCMNLIFTNKPEHLIILTNEHLIGTGSYIELFSKLNNSKIQYKILHYPTIRNLDTKNNTNGEFYININEIGNYLKQINI